MAAFEARLLIVCRLPHRLDLPIYRSHFHRYFERLDDISGSNPPTPPRVVRSSAAASAPRHSGCPPDQDLILVEEAEEELQDIKVQLSTAASNFIVSSPATASAGTRPTFQRLPVRPQPRLTSSQ